MAICPNSSLESINIFLLFEFSLFKYAKNETRPSFIASKFLDNIFVFIKITIAITIKLIIPAIIENHLIEKAEAKSEHVWLFYHDTDKASKLLKSINKHPRLQLIQYSPELITQLSQCIQKQIKWSVMIDGDLLTVAADDLFVESEIHQYHPLTVPKLDFIH